MTRHLKTSFLLLFLITFFILSTQQQQTEQTEQKKPTNTSLLSNLYDYLHQSLPKNSLTVSLTVFFVLFSLKVFFPRPKNQPPSLTYYVPWLGHALTWSRNPIELIKEGYLKLGNIFSVKVAGSDMVMMVGTEAHEAFFSAPEEILSAAKAYRFTIPVFGKGVVYDCEPESLVEQRKMVSNGLTLKRFKTYVDKIVKEVSDYFDEHWKTSGTVDILESLNEITVLTSTRCLHGDEVRNNLNTQFAQLYLDLDKALSPFSFFYPYAPTPVHRRRDQARLKIKHLFSEIIRKRKETGAAPEDMLQTLVESTTDDGKTLTVDEICGMMTALMLAGQHTSNVTSTWLAVHLLTHPDALKRVMMELDEHWPIGTELDFNKLRSMTFLHNCVKETLRLRPPIILVMRTVVKEFRFKEYVIRPGSMVCVSPAVAHRLESFYTNPDTFDPDRFSKERHEDKNNKYSYLAFSSGRHSCIGEQFAYVQIKTIFATMLRRYKLELKRKDIKPDYTTMIVAPVPPVTVAFEQI